MKCQICGSELRGDGNACGKKLSEGNPFSCSAWTPIDVEPVPEGLVCDMVRCGWDRMTNVVYLDEWVYFEDALHFNPNGDTPDPIELCPIDEITHWAEIVAPNSVSRRGTNEVQP